MGAQEAVESRLGQELSVLVRMHCFDLGTPLGTNEVTVSGMSEAVKRFLRELPPDDLYARYEYIDRATGAAIPEVALWSAEVKMPPAPSQGSETVSG